MNKLLQKVVGRHLVVSESSPLGLKLVEVTKDGRKVIGRNPGRGVIVFRQKVGDFRYWLEFENSIHNGYYCDPKGVSKISGEAPRGKSGESIPRKVSHPARTPRHRSVDVEAAQMEAFLAARKSRRGLIESQRMSLGKALADVMAPVVNAYEAVMTEMEEQRKKKLPRIITLGATGVYISRLIGDGELSEEEIRYKINKLRNEAKKDGVLYRPEPETLGAWWRAKEAFQEKADEIETEELRHIDSAGIRKPFSMFRELVAEKNARRKILAVGQGLYDLWQPQQTVAV